MPMVNVAELVLNRDILMYERSNAAAILKHRLEEFNGAMWIVTPLHERNEVIRALKVTA
jgi:hypothetical protein